jgi:hypothetical protein
MIVADEPLSILVKEDDFLDNVVFSSIRTCGISEAQLKR